MRQPRASHRFYRPRLARALVANHAGYSVLQALNASFILEVEKR